MKKDLDFYRQNFQSLSFSGEPIEDQETVIVFSRNSQTASVETTDPTVLTKLKRCVSESPNDWSLTAASVRQGEQDPMKVVSVCLECSKKLISIRSKTAKGRELTDEQRAVIANRLRNLRKKNNQTNTNIEED